MKKFYITALALAFGVALHAQEVSKTPFGQQIQSSSNSVNKPTIEDEDSVLWEQAVSTDDMKYSITSSHYDLAEWGMYAADDFKFDVESTINSILFYGSQSDPDGKDYINGVNIYFYEDENDSPAGNPAEEGSEILHLTIDYDSEFVDVQPGEDAFLGNKIYAIDLEGYFGEGITLDSGTYWISIVFNLELEENDFDIRWLWSDSEADNMNPPKLIAPNPDGDLYFPEWTPISDIGFPMSSMAFTLYGEEGVLSTTIFDQADISIYPNPVQNELFFKGTLADDIESVTIFNSIGQLENVIYKNGIADVSHLSSGVYIVRIKTSNGVVSKKLIKN